MTRKTLIAAIAAALALAGYGAFSNDLALAALGIVLTIASLATFGFLSARTHRAADISEGLAPEERSALRPIRRLHAELDELAQSAQSESVRVVASEALEDSAKILDQAVKMISLRSEIKRVLGNAYRSETGIEELEQRLGEAPNEEEKEELQRAIEARQREAQHYRQLEDALRKIDTSLKQAEATLSEIKAKLAVSVTFPEEQDEDTRLILQDSMNRLRTLSVSFDEAEELLKGRIA